MIRAIYRWRIAPGRRPAFETWWHEGTLRIRATRAGALGSTLLRPLDDDTTMVAVATWRSRTDLESFWATPAGEGLEGVELVSAEVFDVVDDLTAAT